MSDLGTFLVNNAAPMRDIAEVADPREALVWAAAYILIREGIIADPVTVWHLVRSVTAEYLAVHAGSAQPVHPVN